MGSLTGHRTSTDVADLPAFSPFQLSAIPLGQWSETEDNTRAERIDPALVATGWDKVEGSRIRREASRPGRIQSGGRRDKDFDADRNLKV